MVDARTAYLEMAVKIFEKAQVPNVLEQAFPQQISFIKSKSKYKLLFCTRRAAKSYTAGLALVDAALNNPGCNCLFFALTRDSARSIIWKDILKVINRKYGLGAAFNETALSMTFPNGSVIYVTGIDVDENEMHKLLGRKFRLVCGDEASMYTIDTSNLVYGVLDPAVTDPNDEGESGSICLFGTASNFPRGLFFDITTGKEGGWEVFRWSAHDNPYVAKQWAEKLEEIRTKRPAYMETPQYKQWYLNLWEIDEKLLVYRFDMSRNLCRELPRLSKDGWTYVLGVDTGWEDDSAFVLTAYHTNDPHLYIPRVFKKKEMTFDDVVNKIQEFMRDPIMSPHKVIIDGANKQGVESMRQRSSIPFEYADKNDKVSFIELCNSDLIESRIKILDTAENRPLWEEMSGLIWVTDAGKIKYPKKEHPNLPNHLTDAFLYSWRCGWHYAATPVEKKVIVGSKDWYLQQSEEIWERERESLTRQDDWIEMGTLGDLE